MWFLKLENVSFQKKEKKRIAKQGLEKKSNLSLVQNVITRVAIIRSTNCWNYRLQSIGLIVYFTYQKKIFESIDCEDRCRWILMNGFLALLVGIVLFSMDELVLALG